MSEEPLFSIDRIFLSASATCKGPSKGRRRSEGREGRIKGRERRESQEDVTKH